LTKSILENRSVCQGLRAIVPGAHLADAVRDGGKRPVSLPLSAGLRCMGPAGNAIDFGIRLWFFAPMSNGMTERERIAAILRGEPCDRIPWATRLDIWHAAATRSGSMPEKYEKMDLMDIHRDLGIGRQSYALAALMKLRGVDVSVEFEGDIIRRETDPMLNFPVPREYVASGKPGDTRVLFSTPAGRALVVFRTTETSIREAEMPFLMRPILKDDDDFDVVRWILDHAEYVPFDKPYHRAESAIGDFGFTIPVVGRIPFQSVMLDYMGETETIYALSDRPQRILYLLDALKRHALHILEIGMALPSPMVEYTDNFEGMVTSPDLFRTYCIPFMQEAADRVHGRGKVLGSHMDGNMKPLVHLVPESGIDVVESFSPAPLTPLPFSDAWREWRNQVLMWGVIPSTIFEPHVHQDSFELWIETLFDCLDGSRGIILGIGDQAIGPTLTERIRYVSDRLDRQTG